MKMVYIIILEKTGDNIAVFSSLKKAREYISKKDYPHWYTIEYHKLR